MILAFSAYPDQKDAKRNRNLLQRMLMFTMPFVIKANRVCLLGSSFVFKIHTKTLSMQLPFDNISFWVLCIWRLVEKRKTPASGFKRSATGAILREMYCRLTTEQRFIKLKRLASRGAVMDPWRVFFLDLFVAVRINVINRCPPEAHASARTLRIIEMVIYLASVFPLRLFPDSVSSGVSGRRSSSRNFQVPLIIGRAWVVRVLKNSRQSKKGGCYGRENAFGVTSSKRLTFTRAPKKNASGESARRGGHKVKRKVRRRWMQMLKATHYSLAVLYRASRVIVWKWSEMRADWRNAGHVSQLQLRQTWIRAGEIKCGDCYEAAVFSYYANDHFEGSCEM